MKTILIIIAVVAAIYLLTSNSSFHTKPVGTTGDYGESSGDSPTDKSTITKPDSLLRICFYQDCSSSNFRAGIELVSSEIFMPYFEEVNRNIELNFGCIQNTSAKKLITVKLNARHFHKPVIPDKSKVAIAERKVLVNRYEEAFKDYAEDSIQYYSQRTADINQFREKVDSAISVFRKKLSGETDLATAITIADKTFNASISDGASNILILYSDGQDSYGREITSIHNKALVVLVNAGGLMHSSLDPIITTTFQAPEEAILYSLQTF